MSFLYFFVQLTLKILESFNKMCIFFAFLELQNHKQDLKFQALGMTGAVAALFFDLF